MKKILFLVAALIVFATTNIMAQEKSVIDVELKNGKTERFYVEDIAQIVHNKVNGYGIDVEKTRQYCTVNYNLSNTHDGDMMAPVIYEQGIKVIRIVGGTGEILEYNFLWSELKPDWNNLSEGIPSKIIGRFNNNAIELYTMFKSVQYPGYLQGNSLVLGKQDMLSSESTWAFNNNTPFAVTEYKSNADGSMTIEYIAHGTPKKIEVKQF